MRVMLASVMALAAAPAIAATAPAAVAGAQAYERDCAGCHSLDGHSTANGPALDGVVWRKVASLPDFAYSAALKRVIGDWSPGRLDAYLRNTQGFASGTTMFWTIADAAERKAIIAYLATVK